jgi:hypothetical protein
MFPGGGGPFGGGSGGTNPLFFVLIAVLALGTIGFGIATVVNYNAASVATKTLNEQVAAAVDVAKKEQKKADDEAFRLASESPYRSYVAPVEFGSFEIKFPKTWSGWVDHQQQGNQVTLLVNPDFVRRSQGQDELTAGRILLIERTRESYMQQYTALVKQGKLKQADITVSGQKAYDITGVFQDKKTTRVVIVPVRDKVLVFINENSKYASQFNEILAQAKVIP